VRSSSGRPRSRRLAALVPLCAALLANGGETPPSDAAALILGATQARYDAVVDMRASFAQHATVASLGTTEISSGVVLVKRPGRMRWEYSVPEARVIALDGETLRIYIPEDKQLQIASVSQGAFSPTALDFLLGDGDLTETFRATQLPDGDDGTLRLKLDPLEDARFQHLELWVAPVTHQLRGSVLVDMLGNRTEVRFSNLVENKGVAEEHFTIEVPADTEVIDLR
jgi:outer membrane lipoprotein carrier protein